MQEAQVRPVPRPFSLHWGSGQIVEEAVCVAEHHRPAVQLLKFEDGSEGVRFCYYDHAGRFQRSLLILGQDELAGLRDALAGTPRLRALLRGTVG